GVGANVSRTSRAGMGAASLGTARLRGATAAPRPGPSGIGCVATVERSRRLLGRLGPAPAGGLNTSCGLRGNNGFGAENRAGPNDSAITFIGRSTVRIPV